MTITKQTSRLRFLVIGAGSRGSAYAQAVTTSTPGVIHAVADPHVFKRRDLGRSYIWGSGEPGPGQEFGDWREWVEWERRRREEVAAGENTSVGVDGVFICTLDETHLEILTALAPLDLHILCEKPLALSLSDCLSAYRALSPFSSGGAPSKIFSIGHVLRYSPHNILLRNLLLRETVIGAIVSLEHCEPVGWWHFSHSYVRGNWRRETSAARDGSLLTKSCHDIDFILWLLCSPPPEAETSPEAGASQLQKKRYHQPRSISSSGRLTQFRRARKPALAGSATNCLTCPAERECTYSAVRIYRDRHLARGHVSWPVNIVCPDIEDTYARRGQEAAETALMEKLGEDYDRDEMGDEEIAKRPWYGRCVFDADNDVCDDQVVTITWDDEVVSDDDGGQGRTAKTAVFHMIAPTEKQCERRGRVYGTKGELSYDSRSISYYSFETGQTTTVDVPRRPPEEEKAHGGGDYGLARSFVAAVEAVEVGGCEVSEAQARYVGCNLEEAVRSHAVVFAAEEARRDEKVVKWEKWWKEKLASA